MGSRTYWGALGASSTHARYGTVRPQLLADRHVPRRAQGRREDGPGDGGRRIRRGASLIPPRRAAKYVDCELFNGRWFTQKLDLNDRTLIEPFDQNRKAGVLAESFMQAYWSDEYGEIKYQVGDGCLTDQFWPVACRPCGAR